MASRTTANPIEDFTKLVPADRIEALRKSSDAKQLTPELISSLLGEDTLRLFALGRKLEAMEFEKVVAAQKRALAFRAWVTDQLPQVINSPEFIEAIEADETDEGESEKMHPFQDIDFVGTVPFFVPSQTNNLISMLRIDVFSNGGNRDTSLSVSAHDATFISWAITKGVAELLEENTRLVSAGLVDMEKLSILAKTTRDIALEANRCIRTISQLHANDKKATSPRDSSK